MVLEHVPRLDALPKPTSNLFSYLSAQPLYAMCSEQVIDACDIIDMCCVRIHTGSSTADPDSLCIRTTRHEEEIFQYASTDPFSRLAYWVRHCTECDTATDDQAYAAYIMACAAKALEVLSDWMRSAERKAFATGWNETDWSWTLYCDYVSSQSCPDDRIAAIDLYTLHLDPITTLACLRSDTLTPFAVAAIKKATRRKGGVLSGVDRKHETSARDSAIVGHALDLLTKGMQRRYVTTTVHRWFEREITKPESERPGWATLETSKALTRKRVEEILKQHNLM
ncbi:hypothetical protein [Pseudomonas alliivorans]